MFIGIGVISASSSYSQTAVLSLNVHNKTLKDVFREIESQSEYIFFYNDAAVNVNKRVDISIEKGTINQILDKVLDGSSKYRIEDRQVIIFKDNVGENTTTGVLTSSTKDVVQTGVTVTGRITDAEGEPLPGVSVTEKGTMNGVITDIDGNYSIVLRGQNPVLVFSYIGHEPQEKTVGSQRVINAVMQTESSDLDEVVVVAYGTQRKSSITGAISTVNVDRMKDLTTPTVSNMLQGKVAGVSVVPQSGQPGSEATIRIRGIGSIRGNKDPLWVIDGMVSNNDVISALNPNDIEAISILKDGSATALYGSRGANGVILVTTKRGRMGMSQLDVTARMSVSELQKGRLEMMNGSEYYDYLEQIYKNTDSNDTYLLQPYLKDQNTDWFDIATQSALTQNYNISYRYGNEKIRSYIAGDYYNEEGTIRGYTLDRFTLRLNNDFIVNKRLTIKANLAAMYRETDSQEYSLSSWYSYLPWDTPYDSQGNLKDGSQGRPTESAAPTADPRDYWYSDGSTNYLYDRHLNWSRSRRNTMDVGLGLNYKLFDFLTFESNNRFSFYNHYGSSYTDPESRSGQATDGAYSSSSTNTRNITGSQMLRFLKTFGEKHEIDAYFVYDYDERRYWYDFGRSYSVLTGTEILSGGVSDYYVEGSKTEEKHAKYLFNGNYTFDGKYLLQASLSRDGSSRFGINKRWGTFWSVGGGWNMHKEEFIKGLGFINELKPRISYGITGNEPSGAYEWTTKFNTTQQYGGELAFMTNYAGNANLSWEETGSLDIGLETRLFNRVSVNFDYYSKKVKNLLYLRHLSAVTGYNRQTANDGKLENSGFEVTITPEIIKTRDLYWDISFNIGYNKNKITYLPDGDDLGSYQAVAVGYPYLNWYMREWAGVDSQTGKGLWFIVDSETGQKTATTDYDAATPVLLDSSPTPKYNGAVSTSFAWKGLSLNALFTFSAGAKIYNGTRAGSIDRDGARPSQAAMKLADGWSRWEKPGDIATHPQLGVNDAASSTSSRYLEDGDFFKMKSLSIGYALPKKWLIPIGAKEATISIGGENLFTITKYSGVDPEILLSSNYNGTTSASSGQVYPTIRRFTFGINLRF
ncbi:TonB-linked SusC/RagA family outer membrane protein [Dysgonomonas hofstadii]|uniref:TonB-linked SusC/RagA family outer membrane protein n=1 Tax=Dysgonomonas hofstadii TaxID=637886 RepID=A0A840CDZ5_9BACT|nr:TonB-dependent receptor [Dysgonomonas hofstadii]MBB4034160.1 TonB-linked SusC/RagA family outer membrane protein [Dysgonomonas hofstadii]